MKNDLSRRHRVLTPESPSVEAFDDPIAAVARLSAIYDTNTGFLRDAFARYRRHESITEHVRVLPFVRIRTDVNTHVDSRRSYGFVAGVFETTVTRPISSRTTIASNCACWRRTTM